jgi:hypothetical protein
MFERMVSGIEHNQMKTVVDRTVAFALKLMQRGGRFGKIVVQSPTS